MERWIYHFKFPMVIFWFAIFAGEIILAIGLATLLGGTPRSFQGTLEIAGGAAMMLDAIIIAIVVSG